MVFIVYFNQVLKMEELSFLKAIKTNKRKYKINTLSNHDDSEEVLQHLWK